nr:MAG TPA: hypothetical protein [Caudoviricetes sp.]
MFFYACCINRSRRSDTAMHWSLHVETVVLLSREK